MSANDALANRQRGLGKGLAVLLGETPDEPEADIPAAEKTVHIERLTPGRLQPRTHFDEAEIESLAASVRQQGIIQPLLVRPIADEVADYEIIAGERRWRAAQRAGVHEVPVIIRDLDDDNALEIALVENLQRQDLGPIEEATAFRRLIDEFGHTQEEIAESLGKSRSHVANTLRLLSLPQAVRDLLEAGDISAGHARALLGAPEPEALAAAVAKKGLNVRQTEAMVRRAQDPSVRTNPKHSKVIDPNISALEKELTAKLGLRVTISQKGEGGSLSIAYRTLEQLEGLLKRID